MFSKYDEIAKMIRSFIENALAGPFDINILKQSVMSNYSYEITMMDLTNLYNTITMAKKRRMDYNTAQANSHMVAVTDWTNALEKAKENAAIAEGAARNLAYKIATKACITLYRGPLTMDTMAELEENEYDGTYGSTTMMQMYSLYKENKRLQNEQIKNQETVLTLKKEVDDYRQRYTLQHTNLEKLKLTNENLERENEASKAMLVPLQKEVKELKEQVERSISSFPSQILQTMKGFFGNFPKEPEDNQKAMQ